MKKRFVPSALIAALALVACSEQNQTATAEKTAPVGESAAAIPADAKLAANQTITINNGAEPESLDPHKVSGVPESNLIRQMLIGLTTTDNDGNTIPGMASEWSTDDNKVWTFKIRDAKWSNGDPVTAQDFEYSFKRLTDPATASPYATYLADFGVINAQDIVDGKTNPDQLGVKALDDKTLQITLAEPVPYFPDVLIHTSVKPVNKKAIDTHGDKWTSPGNFVANGPYNLKDWQINERIVLERNPSYYDDANTTINEVVMLAVPESTTETSRYKAGEIDVTNSIPSDQFQQLKAELGDQVKVAPKLCTYYYEFNHTKAPFNDERVRHALSLAMDRDIIVDQILGQGQEVAYQFTPTSTQGMKNYTPEWKSWDKAKRIEEAKKLLSEAGYSESNPLNFELLYNTSEDHKKLAVAAASFWKDSLGFVNVNLNNQEWKTYLDTRRKQEHQMSRGGWCADYNEASTFLNTFKSDNSSNYGKYSNPEFDKLMLSTLGADVTPESRGEIYRQAEEVLDKDAATIFVYHYVSAGLVKPYVAGYSSKDPQSTYQVKNWKILEH
ncbi:ABC transporter substrate-binding protein [Moraxella nasovis]|uniref:ABC transporter substrate-binding protein n=1 Tax=Moraxella nasovis TaxID=2904121 RepID=UPI001F611C48|nr:ABC transporter substrate-binding protein [Moraxella nasovis]UNU73207.1 ABC transporter substrate-binding protein [Moraxella nasovis]